MAKKYLSLERLTEYDALIKTKIDSDIENHTHSWNDLDDKPFYSDSVENILLEETEVFVYKGNTWAWMSDRAFTLEDGKTYRVVFNGVSYECVAYTTSAGDVVIGNLGLTYTGTGGNGEPFCIRTYNLCTQYDGTYTVSVAELQESFVPLSDNYIPDTIARTQYVDTEVAKKANKSHTHDDRYYTETEVDGLISSVNTSIGKITSGTTPVKEANHATNADSATSSLDAEKLGGQLPSYYAKASDIPTGALADKDIVSESDLDTALAEKVNAASEGNHSHSNKTVLDGITSTKVSNWDNAEANAKAYADEKVANLLDNSTEAVDSIMELAEAMENNADAIEALEAVAASKVPTSRKVNGKALTSDITLSASDVGADASGSASAVQTNLDSHIADAVKHITATERTNWGAAYTHSTSAHAPSNAQVNVIESIKVNGTAQTITSKSVNIAVPTDNSQLANGAGYITSSAITNKADKATTLSGYGITNAYTKSEVDAKTVVDSALSSSSANPVQNKVVNSAIATATSAISANTSSIAGHTDRISALETKVGDGFAEITSAEIQALFA